MPSAALTTALEFAALRGSVALITGGGRGLAAAIATTLGAADIAAQRVQDFDAVLAERDIDVIALPLDVSHPTQCAEAIDTVAQRFGRLDALVTHAAIDTTAPVGELSVQEWQRIVATNLRAPFMLGKHAAAMMARQGSGHNVNISSTAAKRGWPNASAYHATEWDLLSLCHALHAELRRQGIKVTAVVAGGMRTPFLTERFPDIDTNLLQDPMHVARMVRFVLQQPAETYEAEVTVLPMRETSWP